MTVFQKAPEPHQVLAELLLGFGLRQDAGVWHRRRQHERAGKPLRAQKLGKDRAHGMAEKHGARRDRLEEGLKLGAVFVHANANKVFAASFALAPWPMRSGEWQVQPRLSNIGLNLSKHQAPSLAPCSMTMSWSDVENGRSSRLPGGFDGQVYAMCTERRQ
jgi:hypothetical protein